MKIRTLITPSAPSATTTLVAKIVIITLIVTIMGLSNGYAENSPGKQSPSSPESFHRQTHVLTAQRATIPRTKPIRTQVIATRLEVPWQIAFAPERRVFVTERSGTVLTFTQNNANNLVEKRAWLKLTNVYLGSEAGLLGIATDPNFAKNKLVYIAYNYVKTVNGERKAFHRLARYTDVTTAQGQHRGKFDRILIDNIPAANIHDGGRLLFDTPKTLLWGVGDVNLPRSAQNLARLTGKILRLNKNGSIPANNPFPNSYVYSYGLRNVQGITRDRTHKRIFASDHGPSSLKKCCRDEINQIFPASNYGWPLVSGDEKTNSARSPLIHSGTNQTWAPSGLVYIDAGAWENTLLVTGLRGEALYHIALSSPTSAPAPTQATLHATYFKEKWGRLRDIAKPPQGYGFADNHYYVLTSNRDGRGFPTRDDDRIILLTLPN